MFLFLIQAPGPNGQNPEELEACVDVDDEEEEAPIDEEAPVDDVAPEDDAEETTAAPKRPSSGKRTTPKHRHPTTTTPAPEDGDDNEDKAGQNAPEDAPKACVDPGN